MLCGALEAYFRSIILDVALSLSHHASCELFKALSNSPFFSQFRTATQTTQLSRQLCSTRPSCASYLCFQTEVVDNLAHSCLYLSFFFFWSVHDHCFSFIRKFMFVLCLTLPQSCMTYMEPLYARQHWDPGVQCVGG